MKLTKENFLHSNAYKKLKEDAEKWRQKEKEEKELEIAIYERAVNEIENKKIVERLKKRIKEREAQGKEDYDKGKWSAEDETFLEELQKILGKEE